MDRKQPFGKPLPKAIIQLFSKYENQRGENEMGERVMTEHEIETTKNVGRAMDQKEKEIILAVILEERHADPARLRQTICEGYCYWARVCGSRGALDDHCRKCAISEQWETVFGRNA